MSILCIKHVVQVCLEQKEGYCTRKGRVNLHPTLGSEKCTRPEPDPNLTWTLAI